MTPAPSRWPRPGRGRSTPEQWARAVFEQGPAAAPLVRRARVAGGARASSRAAPLARPRGRLDHRRGRRAARHHHPDAPSPGCCARATSWRSTTRVVEWVTTVQFERPPARAVWAVASPDPPPDHPLPPHTCRTGHRGTALALLTETGPWFDDAMTPSRPSHTARDRGRHDRRPCRRRVLPSAAGLHLPRRLRAAPARRGRSRRPGLARPGQPGGRTPPRPPACGVPAALDLARDRAAPATAPRPVPARSRPPWPSTTPAPSPSEPGPRGPLRQP